MNNICRHIKKSEMIRRTLVAVFALGLTGCAVFAPWTQLKAQEYRDTARGFKTSVPIGWMRFNMVNFFLMTKDGTVLDKIIVERRKIDTKLEFTKKKFAKDMTAQELAEVEIDNIKTNPETGKFELLSNKPVTIAGQSAFHLEYTFTFTEGGLKIKGDHYGFVYKDWIYRVNFEAAAQHYFEKCLGDFKRFMESFELL